MRRSNGFLGLILIFSFVSSCEWSKTPLPSPPAPISDSSGISFSNDVVPILKTNCNYSGCHNSENTANFPLETYSDVINYGQVQAGNPNGSDMYNVIASGFMPLGGSLSDASIQLIHDWIVQGALDN